MLTLKAKLLEVKELPAKDPYPPSCLVAVLAGTETLHLLGRHELVSQLGGLDPFSDVSFELRWRRIDLATLGGKGKAYRLSIQQLDDARKGR